MSAARTSGAEAAGREQRAPGHGAGLRHVILSGGVGIGFANAVRRGPIGAIGPSGTGLQEFTCQVHHAGSGISHAIGTGSHDLSDEIGGITTWVALEALEADPRRGRSPWSPSRLARATVRQVGGPAGACRKPVVACLLGGPLPDGDPERADAGLARSTRRRRWRCRPWVPAPSTLRQRRWSDPGLRSAARRVPAQRFLRGCSPAARCAVSRSRPARRRTRWPTPTPRWMAPSVLPIRRQPRAHPDRHGG